MKRALWGCLLVGYLFAGCRSGAQSVTMNRPAPSASLSAARPLPVEVFTVAAAPEGRAQPVPAIIAAAGTAVVLAKRDGVIVWLGGQEGTRVKAGDVLARLSDDDSAAQLRQAELEITRLQIEERQYEAMLKVNQSELARQQKLARDGLNSQSEIERAQYKVEVSEQELDKTKLATRMAQARREAVKLEVEKTVLRAPLTGLVTQRLAQLGTSVVRNDKLFELAPHAPLQVRFQLAQTDAWQPQPGALLPLALTGEQRAVATARLQRRAPVADAASNARSYFATLPFGTALIPGTAVSVLRPHTTVSRGWWIPRAALAATQELQPGTSAVLWVVENDQCAARTVWLGATASDQVEIRTGLQAGDRIILTPPPELQAGTPVTVNNL
jgi:RND family efflux transporter MFP subunit